MRRLMSYVTTIRGAVSDERYIDGYANYGSTVTFKMNGTKYSTSRDSSTGYWKYSITDNLGDDFVITSLEDAFAADTTGYGTGDGVITYVNFQNAGGLAYCTSLYRFAYNQKTLQSVSFPTSYLNSIKYLQMCFNECNALTHLDLSYLNLTNVKNLESKKDSFNSAFNNCTSLEKLILPDIYADVYFGSYCFRNCTALTTLSIKSIQTKNAFNLQYSPLSNASIQGLLNNAINGVSGGTLNVTSAVFETITTTFSDLYTQALANSWTIQAK